jgi:hypothetical protein
MALIAAAIRAPASLTSPLARNPLRYRQILALKHHFSSRRRTPLSAG